MGDEVSCKHNGGKGICRCYTDCGHSDIKECEARLAALNGILNLSVFSDQKFSIYLAMSPCAVKLGRRCGVKNPEMLVPEQW